MTQASVLTVFKQRVADSLALFQISQRTDATGTNLLIPAEQAFIIEAAFLRIHMAWERFVEDSFTGYMMGFISTSGKTVPTFAQPKTIEHACDMTRGVSKYVDWSNPDIVIRLAKVFFDNGEPFASVLASIHGTLLDLKTVRNAAAHLSSQVSVQLDALATRKLKKAVTGISVSAFVLSADPHAPAGTTILDSQLVVLNAASSAIASA